MRFIHTELLEMFPQFQNIFPFFVPSLYHLSSTSSELFTDETEESWKVYPPFSFNSFVPSKHVRNIVGKREVQYWIFISENYLSFPQTPSFQINVTVDRTIK